MSSPRRALALLTLLLGCRSAAPATAPTSPPPAPSASVAPVAPVAPSAPPVAPGPPALRPIDESVPLRPATSPSPLPAPVATGPGPTEVERALASLRPRMRQCYQRELDRDPGLSARGGRWELRLDPQGKVTRATRVCSARMAAELERCLARAYESVSLGPGAGAVVTVGECPPG